MTTKIIKTEEEYREAIAQAEVLVTNDPEAGSKDAEHLELLALLIEDFERRNFTFDVPDPISAIEFRMEEQGLRQRDLIPILGSRSRVSEVLGRKRPLTIPMIRALSEKLGIPTDVLIREPGTFNISESAQLDETNWEKFPILEMQKRGWITIKKTLKNENTGDLVRNFLLNTAKIPEAAPLYRRRLKGLGVNSFEDKATYSTLAWTARILQLASLRKVRPAFQIKNINEDFLRNVALLSKISNGPKKAIDELEKIGIRVIVEPSLPGTLVDGAALLDQEMQPVVALTLRFDRVDYFWFTLMHELVHVWKHLNQPSETFIDRIDASDDSERQEKEANRVARDILIPRSDWSKSIARVSPSSQTIMAFAEEQGIHPAIVAGRIRYETNSYNRFGKLLGQGTVRKLFNGVNFS